MDASTEAPDMDDQQILKALVVAAGAVLAAALFIWAWARWGPKGKD